MIGELEEAFLRACPSFLPHLKTLREDHKLFGADLKTELTEILDKLGFHLGSSAKQVPTPDILQVLKVVERVRFGGRGQGSLIRYEGSDVWYSAYCVRGK